MKQNSTTPNANYTTAPSEDSWGFYGVVQHNEHMNEAEAAQAFADAFEIFRSAPWQPTDIAIRNFLRSRWGRHFADSTSFYDGSFKSRIQQASGEKWVAQEFASLARQGFDTELFEDDDIA
ncbi:hypothetical protein H5P28_00885 [Ruficoccus amylovorans]|uniref:Uncharacterized protein n=1 Tax=Ruficoccus amylovorans TaxID=1804625 RepID=A0A842HAQ7_9BACT|nr:hypothetical protein [Ruficoccus amylovorans]MBC2592806.1 hypothetical protein [Ruficoccus amylovorans]